METAEHREPCEARVSRTVLGAPGGEILPGDSSLLTVGAGAGNLPLCGVERSKTLEFQLSETLRTDLRLRSPYIPQLSQPVLPKNLAYASFRPSAPLHGCRDIGKLFDAVKAFGHDALAEIATQERGMLKEVVDGL